MALEKATITNTVSGERIPVLFNPEEYTLNRDINYRPDRHPRAQSRRSCSSSTATSQTLEMELLLDTYETHATAAGALNQAGDDVRRLTRARSPT